jgi:hypothetical protein
MAAVGVSDKPAGRFRWHARRSVVSRQTGDGMRTADGTIAAKAEETAARRAGKAG